MQWRVFSSDYEYGSGSYPSSSGDYNNFLPGIYPRGHRTKSTRNGNEIITFGGMIDSDPENNANQLWVYGADELKGQRWKFIGGATSVGGQYLSSLTSSYALVENTPWPGGRNRHCIAMVNSHTMVLFGGQGNGGTNYISSGMNDLWVLDTDSYIWSFEDGDFAGSVVSRTADHVGSFDNSDEPGGRYTQGCTKGPEDDQFLFYGGFENFQGGTLNDLWIYSLDEHRWKCVWMNTNKEGMYADKGEFSSTAFPRARINPNIYVIDSDLVLISFGRYTISGGSDYYRSLSDVWIYSFSRNQWKWTSGYGYEYPREENHDRNSYFSIVLAGSRIGFSYFNEETREIVYFGGRLYENYYGNDLISYNVDLNLYRNLFFDESNTVAYSSTDPFSFDETNLPGGQVAPQVSVFPEYNRVVIIGGDPFDGNWEFGTNLSYCGEYSESSALVCSGRGICSVSGCSCSYHSYERYSYLWGNTSLIDDPNERNRYYGEVCEFKREIVLTKEMKTFIYNVGGNGFLSLETSTTPSLFSSPSSSSFTSITIQMLEADDSFLYDIIVNNEDGDDDDDIVLGVEDLPDVTFTFSNRSEHWRIEKGSTYGQFILYEGFKPSNHLIIENETNTPKISSLSLSDDDVDDEDDDSYSHHEWFFFPIVKTSDQEINNQYHPYELLYFWNDDSLDMTGDECFNFFDNSSSSFFIVNDRGEYLSALSNSSLSFERFNGTEEVDDRFFLWNLIKISNSSFLHYEIRNQFYSSQLLSFYYNSSETKESYSFLSSSSPTNSSFIYQHIRIQKVLQKVGTYFFKVFDPMSNDFAFYMNSDLKNFSYSVPSIDADRDESAFFIIPQDSSLHYEGVQIWKECSAYCFGIASYYKNVCSGRGNCSSSDNCTCEELYFGETCELTTCNGVQSDDEDVCSSHGDCTQYNQCVCDKGYYRSENDSTICFPCPRGTYSDVSNIIGIANCYSCEEAYVSIEGSSSCSICSEGTYSDEFQEFCELCPPGTYRDEQGGKSESDCFFCPPGAYSNERGSIECEDCDRGSFNADWGRNSTCELCPAGTYSNSTGNTGQDDCLPCKEGYYSEQKGIFYWTDCTPCDVGYRNPLSGANSSSYCIECRSIEACPKGSSFEIQSTKDFSERVIYPELFEALDDVDFSVKITIMFCVLLLGISFIWFISCCTIFNHCFLSSSSSSFFFILKLFQFRIFDSFFNMSHDVDEGFSSIKRKTDLGGCCSIFAFTCASILILWSFTDFIYGNKRVSERIEFFFGGGNEELNGDFIFVIDIHGSFDNCSGSSTIFGFSGSGITINDDDDACFDGGNDFVGCRCRRECTDCSIVNAKEMEIEFSFHQEYSFIHLIEYFVYLDHFDEDIKNTKIQGRLYEDNDTITAVTTQLSFFVMRYTYISSVDLLTQTIDIDFSHNETGFGGTILSSETTKEKNVDPNDDVLTITFLPELSNFVYVMEEYLSQTALNFIAQVFSLISLCVGVVGVFFGQGDKIQIFFSKISSVKMKKKEEKEEQQHEQKRKNIEKNVVDDNDEGSSNQVHEEENSSDAPSLNKSTNEFEMEDIVLSARDDDDDENENENDKEKEKEKEQRKRNSSSEQQPNEVKMKIIRMEKELKELKRLIMKKS